MKEDWSIKNGIIIVEDSNIPVTQMELIHKQVEFTTVNNVAIWSCLPR